MIPPRDNPFRVDRVSSLPFLGEDLEALADQFLALRQAALVGPHGVGKSTLLRSIGRILAARGEEIVSFALPGSATPAQRRAVVRTPSRRTAIVLFDGYEQLSRWQSYEARRRFPRLLVTAHVPVRSLPTLCVLRPTLESLDRVLAALLDNVPTELAAHAQQLFAQYHGDIRQVLFNLYDEIAH